MSSGDRLPDFLWRHGETMPEQLAASGAGEAINWRELEDLVLRWQARLIGLGLKRGDRVGMMCPPGLEYLACLLATIDLGAVWVGLNPRYREEEVAYILGDVDPRLTFYRATFEDRDYRPEFAALAQRFAHCGFHDLADLADTQPLDRARRDLLHSGASADDAAVIVYTSGSTGRPKGAVLSHAALVLGARAQLGRWGLDRVAQICAFPINHVACTGDVVATTLVAGGTLHFEERFRPEDVLAACRDGRINLLLAVPTMLHMIMADSRFDERSFAALDLIVWGGAPLPRDTIARLMTMGPRLTTLYGMTEAAANTTYTEEGASLDVLFETVGKPLPEFPTRIRAGELDCGPGQPGEIQHRLEFTRLGYWNRPEATRDVTTADGWYRTGDLGMWRDDGNIKLVGRLKDMFKSGGYNVYPREVEIALETHPAVATAVVVPVADPLYQEVGVAYVAAVPGAALDVSELRDHARSRLANYKVPKYFELAAEFPLLPVGKIDRPALQRAAAARFGGAATP